MPVVWLLGILAVLVVLILRVRLGVLLNLHGREITVRVQIGPLRVRVYPRPARVEKPKKSGRKKKKSAKKKRKKKPEDEKKSGMPSAGKILQAVRALPRPLIRMLAHTIRGTRIKPLDLRVVFGGDPAAAAQNCGYALACVYTGMPVLEGIMSIPDPRISLLTDFDASQTQAEGEIGISCRTGRLLYGVLPILGIVLNLFRPEQDASGGKKSKPKPENGSGGKKSKPKPENGSGGKKSKSKPENGSGGKASVKKPESGPKNMDKNPENVENKGG